MSGKTLFLLSRYNLQNILQFCNSNNMLPTTENYNKKKYKAMISNTIIFLFLHELIMRPHLTPKDH